MATPKGAVVKERLYGINFVRNKLNVYMLPEKFIESADNLHEFPPIGLPEHTPAEFPTRDSENRKLDITELFTLFTASIIKEDVPFTR